MKPPWREEGCIFQPSDGEDVPAIGISPQFLKQVWFSLVASQVRSPKSSLRFLKGPNHATGAIFIIIIALFNLSVSKENGSRFRLVRARGQMVSMLRIPKTSLVCDLQGF